MFTIRPEAKTYILNKGGVIYLEYFTLNSGGCCIPFQPEPAVKFGRPPDVERYIEQVTDCITLYIPRNLPEENLYITLNKFLWHKNLTVEGWRHY